MWLDLIKTFFFSEAPQDTKRRQYFWVGCLGLLCLVVSFVFVSLFFGSEPKSTVTSQEANKPTSIETATSKVDLNEARWYKLEDENKKLKEDLVALKTLFQEGLKSQDEAPSNLEERIQELEAQLVSGVLSPSSSPNPPTSISPPQGTAEREEASSPIYKFSLNLSSGKESKGTLKTIADFIPAGAFARTVLLSGLDASASMTASSDPRPMLLRMIDPGTLPRKFQSDLKDCHCLAAAYGDLSSERIYARLEKLTCVNVHSGEIMETQVAGYIAGSDGKAGIRGRTASKDGQFLARSLVGGVFAGLSNVANPQNRQSMVNPFSPGNSQVSPPNVGEIEF